MEGSNKSPWSRKRKLEARMQRLGEAKKKKLHLSHSINSNATMLPKQTYHSSPQVNTESGGVYNTNYNIIILALFISIT